MSATQQMGVFQQPVSAFIPCPQHGSKALLLSRRNSYPIQMPTFLKAAQEEISNLQKLVYKCLQTFVVTANMNDQKRERALWEQ
jgi:hypothetical protein